MPEESATRPTPIYASYLTFTTLLDWLRETKHIPSQFDRSWWGSKFNGTTGAQLMAGLRFLRLLNEDNRPEDRLETLAFASNEARPVMVAELMRDVYGASLVDGLTKMTPKMMSDAIAALGTTDATHRKAIAFFVNAAKAANVPMPGTIAKQARNRPSAITRKGAGSSRRRGGAVDGQILDKPPVRETPPLDDLERDRVTLKTHPALSPLLGDLAQIAPTWTKAQRDRWKVTWDAVLDYAYPVVDKPG